MVPSPTSPTLACTRSASPSFARSLTAFLCRYFFEANTSSCKASDAGNSFFFFFFAALVLVEEEEGGGGRAARGEAIGGGLLSWLDGVWVGEDEVAVRGVGAKSIWESIGGTALREGYEWLKDSGAVEGGGKTGK